MQEAISRMLDRYNTGTVDAAAQAVREILQQIALLGLWRSRFFEHAAFYGGTALRILHGLDRFSEDLDFTLLKTDEDFDPSRHLASVREEMLAFGFNVTVETRKKRSASAIRSAFVKANTRAQLLAIEIPEPLLRSLHDNQTLKIKLEIDTAPPDGFASEIRYQFQPIPFAVRTCTLPDLFAGKMHALLCRKWKNRVKGRDWYDFVWYAGSHPELHLSHLEARMRQSGHWNDESSIDSASFDRLLGDAIEQLDVDKARGEVAHFLHNPESTELWSPDFFHAAAEQIELV